MLRFFGIFLVILKIVSNKPSNEFLNLTNYIIISKTDKTESNEIFVSNEVFVVLTYIVYIMLRGSFNNSLEKDRKTSYFV